MESELKGTKNQAGFSRWANYYVDWKASSTVDSARARMFLGDNAKRALLDPKEIEGRERSVTAHQDAKDLFIALRKAGLSSPETTEIWISNLHANPSLSSFFVEALIFGEDEGVVSKAELEGVMNRLTKSTESPYDLIDASILERQSVTFLNYRELGKFADKIESNPLASDGVLARTLDSLLDDTHHADWLQMADRVSKNKNMGKLAAETILAGLFAKMDAFKSQDKGAILNIINRITSKNPPGADFDFANYLRRQFIQKN